MRKVKRLTPSFLRKLVKEERKKILRESDPIEAGVEDVEKVDAEEVDAGKEAKTLAKDLDHLKALKIEARKSVKRLLQIKEARKKIRSKILKKL